MIKSTGFKTNSVLFYILYCIRSKERKGKNRNVAQDPICDDEDGYRNSEPAVFDFRKRQNVPAENESDIEFGDVISQKRKRNNEQGIITESGVKIEMQKCEHISARSASGTKQARKLIKKARRCFSE